DVPEQMAQQDAADSRSQSDSPFLRAGMLPRLQALRDRRWVIFALSTMSDDVGSQLDQAVLREGRFDFHIVMDHPTIDAQRRYVLPTEPGRHAKSLVAGSGSRACVGGGMLDLARAARAGPGRPLTAPQERCCPLAMLAARRPVKFSEGAGHMDGHEVHYIWS